MNAYARTRYEYRPWGIHGIEWQPCTAWEEYRDLPAVTKQGVGETPHPIPMWNAEDAAEGIANDYRLHVQCLDEPNVWVSMVTLDLSAARQ